MFLYYDEYIHKFTDSRRSICAEEVYWALGELEELWFTTCLNNWLGVLVDAPHTSLRRRSEGISSTRFGFSRADHFFCCFNGLIQNEQCEIVQRMFFEFQFFVCVNGHGRRLRVKDRVLFKIYLGIALMVRGSCPMVPFRDHSAIPK